MQIAPDRHTSVTLRLETPKIAIGGEIISSDFVLDHLFPEEMQFPTYAKSLQVDAVRMYIRQPKFYNINATLARFQIFGLEVLELLLEAEKRSNRLIEITELSGKIKMARRYINLSSDDVSEGRKWTLQGQITHLAFEDLILMLQENQKSVVQKWLQSAVLTQISIEVGLDGSLELMGKISISPESKLLTLTSWLIDQKIDFCYKYESGQLGAGMSFILDDNLGYRYDILKNVD